MPFFGRKKKEKKEKGKKPFSTFTIPTNSILYIYLSILSKSLQRLSDEENSGQTQQHSSNLASPS